MLTNIKTKVDVANTLAYHDVATITKYFSSGPMIFSDLTISTCNASFDASDVGFELILFLRQSNAERESSARFEVLLASSGDVTGGRFNESSLVALPVSSNEAEVCCER